jgi:hypothetical protein
MAFLGGAADPLSKQIEETLSKCDYGGLKENV